MQVYFDKDADLTFIQDKRIAIFGFGNQGRPQALNLRDSGVKDVRVALREGSASAERVSAEGFEVMPPSEAAQWADVLVMLLPDEDQAPLYREAIAPHLRPNATLVFAHGLAIHFGLIEARADLDIVLVAPKGPGTALREQYSKGGGLISLFAVAQDASGHARATALAYASALGSGRAGILESSFGEECEADLFNEQAVLWGAIPELILAGYETLVEAGFSPEVAYLECLTEVKLIGDLIYERGIAGMREAISNTAEFGALTGGERIVNREVRTEMRRILREVKNGNFVKDLLADSAAGYPRLKASRVAARAHSIENVRERLQALKGE